MENYLQSILLGLTAGLSTGAMLFIAVYGVRQALRIIDLAT